jgi:hypothetical protein
MRRHVDDASARRDARFTGLTGRPQPTEDQDATPAVASRTLRTRPAWEIRNVRAAAGGDVLAVLFSLAMRGIGARVPGGES